MVNSRAFLDCAEAEVAVSWQLNAVLVCLYAGVRMQVSATLVCSFGSIVGCRDKKSAGF